MNQRLYTVKGITQLGTKIDFGRGHSKASAEMTLKALEMKQSQDGQFYDTVLDEAIVKFEMVAGDWGKPYSD